VWAGRWREEIGGQEPRIGQTGTLREANALLKSFLRQSEDHQIVCEYSDTTFGVLSLVATRSERGAQAPLVAGDSALDLPAIGVDSFGKTSFHLRAVFGRGKLTPPCVQGNDAGADAKFLAAEPVVVFPVVGSVCQKPVNIEDPRRLCYSLGKLGRIVARAPTDHGARKQVRIRMAHKRQFGPRPARKGPVALPVHIVGAGVTGFQAGGVHGHLRAVIYQPQLFGALESRPQKRLKSPFFTRRCSA